jgi:hypothetical protein
MAETERSYRCRWCYRASQNPHDVASQYCSCCGSADSTLPKACPHRAIGDPLYDTSKAATTWRALLLAVLIVGSVLGALASIWPFAREIVASPILGVLMLPLSAWVAYLFGWRP